MPHEYNYSPYPDSRFGHDSAVEFLLKAVIERLEYIAELLEGRSPVTNFNCTLKCGGCGAEVTPEQIGMHVCGTGVNK